MMKVSIHRHKRLGSVEFFGIAERSAGSVSLGEELQRIVLIPPGVVRDTVALAIQAGLTLGEENGVVEGIRWVKDLTPSAS